MTESALKEVLIQAIEDLEESEEIIILNPNRDAIANKLLAKIQGVSPNLLSTIELEAVISALNAHKLGFGLDDRDFQTIIGLTKEELSAVANKLKG